VLGSEQGPWNSVPRPVPSYNASQLLAVRPRRCVLAPGPQDTWQLESGLGLGLHPATLKITVPPCDLLLDESPKPTAPQAGHAVWSGQASRGGCDRGAGFKDAGGGSAAGRKPAQADTVPGDSARTAAPPLTRRINQPNHVPGQQLPCAGRRYSIGTGACRKRLALAATPSRTEKTSQAGGGKSPQCQLRRRGQQKGHHRCGGPVSPPGAAPSGRRSRRTPGPQDLRWYPSAGRDRSRSTRGAGYALHETLGFTPA
jgi:hypothetical protein